jgi:hypothetical protein
VFVDDKYAKQLAYAALFPPSLKKTVPTNRHQQLDLSDSVTLMGMTENDAIGFGFISSPNTGREVKLWLDPSGSFPLMIQYGAKFKRLMRLGKDENSMVYLFI